VPAAASGLLVAWGHSGRRPQAPSRTCRLPPRERSSGSRGGEIRAAPGVRSLSLVSNSSPSAVSLSMMVPATPPAPVASMKLIVTLTGLGVALAAAGEAAKASNAPATTARSFVIGRFYLLRCWLQVRVRPPFKPCMRVFPTRLTGGLSGCSITQPAGTGRFRAGGEESIGIYFYLGAIESWRRAGTIAIWGLYDNLLPEQPVPQSAAEGIKAGWLEFALCSFFCRTLSAPG
jgi:hypothetical protein